MAKIKCEIRQHEDGFSLCMKIPGAWVPVESEVVHEFEAISYIDACQQYNDFLGHGKYKPMIDPSTGLPYSEDIAEFE